MTIEDFIKKHGLRSPGRSLVRPVACPSTLLEGFTSAERANALFFTNDGQTIWVAIFDGTFSLVSPKVERFSGPTETDFASLDHD